MHAPDTTRTAGVAPTREHAMWRVLAAWGVHLYTGSGVVLAFLALRATLAADYPDAFRWLLIAMVIDCSDGAMARAVGVKRVLPWFDGTKLDDIVDYITYALVPIVILYAARLAPDGTLGLIVVAAPLLASAYGFCRTDAKTSDHYFRGFPSYWNVVVFYCYALPLSPTATAVLVLTLTALVFAPLKFLYPSRAPRFGKPMIWLGIVWAALMIATVWTTPDTSRVLLWASLAYPAYYVLLSFYAQATDRG